MYRKIYYVFLILLCSTSMFAQEAEELKGAHPWNLEENENGVAEKFAHWSISLDLGFNAFDGDFRSELKHPIWIPSAGLAFEYSFTPIWTLGFGAYYDWYHAYGDTKKGDNAELMLDGMMLRGEVYLAFDLMGACYQNAKRKIFGLDILLGGGAGWYKNSLYYPNEARHHTAQFEPLSDDAFRGPVGFVMPGLMFSFNLGRATTLGIKGTYSYFISDEIDGRGVTDAASKSYDGIIDVSLNLRFKLASKKKTHVKNIAGYHAMENWNKPVPQKDTVLISSRDTIVLSRVDTMYIVQEVGTAATAVVQTVREDDYYFIYFEHNKSNLDDNSLITIQQVATRMKHDESLCAEIVGYADNTGADDHNENLGVARAQNVRDELVEEHNIDPSRVTYSSGGTIKGGRSEGAYSPNRRSDIRLMPCSEFEEIKQANDNRAEMAAEAQAQAMSERENGVITAPEGMTLSAIARKYYGNTYCWVFIYDANKTTLKSPNYIPAGTRLVIPDLTEEQLQISKRNADIFLESINQ